VLCICPLFKSSSPRHWLYLGVTARTSGAVTARRPRYCCLCTNCIGRSVKTAIRTASAEESCTITIYLHWSNSDFQNQVRDRLHVPSTWLTTVTATLGKDLRQRTSGCRGLCTASVCIYNVYPWRQSSKPRRPWSRWE